jgi:hypothetical protein
MTTHERELFETVDLCSPDGARLNPQARGWSRTPLHRANLDGEHGRNKRWDYWAILAGDLVISTVYADIDHFGLSDVWWAELPTGRTGGAGVLVGADAVSLPERCGTEPLRLAHEGYELSITDHPDGTELVAHWREPDGRPGELAVVVGLPAGTNR